MSRWCSGGQGNSERGGQKPSTRIPHAWEEEDDDDDVDDDDDNGNDTNNYHCLLSTYYVPGLSLLNCKVELGLPTS